ncbi:type II toxin-antitoxin system VapC family toxin [Alkanindiges illinoisensis]|uniref:type II toxin-antitoxin system VapC family toxin n=1 Tax=Alkanindiges illinoisensis TaxID=197183 RepID=UPI00047B61C4|nr:type II toxin-antitoxin system VapC family toxin [Alkanindiges illinoisensis]
MILVDTSVWIDHLRASDNTLVQLLQRGQVLAHPFVIGEISLGNLKQRTQVLTALKQLPQAIIAHNSEVTQLVEQHNLFGLGIGYIDAHLLASTLLSAHTKLWTRDKRLFNVAEKLNIHV